jgi:hypothetical protein
LSVFVCEIPSGQAHSVFRIADGTFFCMSPRGKT